MAMSSSTRPGTVWLAPFVVAAGLAAGLMAAAEWHPRTTELLRAPPTVPRRRPPTPPGSASGRADALSTALGSIRSGIRGAAGSVAASGNQSQLLDATKQMQETQMSFDLQYLQLQSQMQDENRSYTAISNIMKTKHDTVKNSSGNIR